MTQTINTVILGASGYTGVELLRLLKTHPAFRIVALTGESQAGKEMGEVYPHLAFEGLPKLVKADEVDYRDVALVFCCLPHGTTQEIIAGLPSHVRIVDLSADFRLSDVQEYAEWYGHAHKAPALQKEAVYGLTEHAREAVKKARLVANPGCYPTSVLLPLVPLLKAQLIAPEGMVIDSLSGVSGAGRGVKQNLLFTELDAGVSAYSVGRHRHMAEIEQELTLACHPGLAPGSCETSPLPGDPGVAAQTGMTVRVSFTPHLMPMTRGMLSTIHVKGNVNADAARAHLQAVFAGEPFVKILSASSPASHHVRGTNQCHIALHDGRLPGELIIVSVIDNLVKGASGQAIQNANLMFGLPETMGLELRAVFP